MNMTAALAEHEEQILWSRVLGCKRQDLVLGTAPQPTPIQAEAFRALALRRLSGEPLQYLTGVQGFRMLELQVGPGVLVPRPETEIVVERCLRRLQGSKAPRVIDIGTGSGAIAIAIATERPDSQVWAVDSSREALMWAGKNVAGSGAVNVHLVEGDLFDPVPATLAGSVDLVVSNPPYLSDQDLLEADPDVRDHEPVAATVAGPSGLELYPRLAVQSLGWLRSGGWLVLETSEGQWGRLRSLLASCFREVAIEPDLAGRLRVAEGRKP